MFSSNQNQLVLVRHTQICLEQSNSKITREKFKLMNFSFHMDTNQEELQTKVVSSSLCQIMFQDLRRRDAFLLIIFIVIAIIVIITIVFYSTSFKIYINDKSD